MEFLSIFIVSVNWRAVLDLETLSSLLLDTKLSAVFFHFVLVYVVKIGFLVIALLGRLFNAECP